MYYSYVQTPIGRLTLVGTEEGIVAIEFPSERDPLVNYEHCQKNDAKLAEAAKQLNEYFIGKRKQFTVPIIM